MISSGEIRGFLEIDLVKPSGLVIPKYRGHNEIQGSLKEYFQDAMDTGSGLNRALDNLFTAGNKKHSDDDGDGTQDNKDGIIVIGNNGSLTTLTTDVTASRTYGQKWKGEIEFTGNDSIDNAIIGNGYHGDGVAPPGSDAYFTYMYANRNNFTAIGVVNADKIIINWEIYIV